MTARHAVLLEKILLVTLAVATPAALRAATAPTSETVTVTAPDNRVQGATLVGMPALLYPEIAKQAHALGVVSVTVLIGKDGRVLEAHAVSGPIVLRRYAEAAIRNWRYEPAVLNSHPVEAATCVKLNFHL